MKTESHVFKYVVIDRRLTHWLPGFFEHFIGLQQLVIEFFKGLTIIRIIMTMIIAIIVIKH